MDETAKLAAHCSEQGLTEAHGVGTGRQCLSRPLLRGGRLGQEASTIRAEVGEARLTPPSPTTLVWWACVDRGSSLIWPTTAPFRGACICDNWVVNAVLWWTNTVLRSVAEPDHNGEHPTVLRLGQRFPCRLRGLDLWSGSLDLALLSRRPLVFRE